ncbi:PAS domain S-box protein [Aeribacillus sp. FSL K6-8210]|uniref:PAS domain S-box protein n=1 Tax=Aeribacillus sp. FSL K6-8210 TaxID=2954683 RepID=UPI0030D33953
MEALFNWELVISSVVMAIIASFFSVHMIQNIQVSTEKDKWLYIMLGTIWVGLGIWSMQFIDMLGDDLYLIATYYTVYTLLSFLLGIIASFAAFSMKDKQKNVSNAAAISIVVGLSIFVIYYIGIKSLKGNEYDGFYSVLSNLIAFVLAGAVIAFFHHNKRSQKLQMKAIIIPSIVLGLGIFIFQYTVMNEIKKAGLFIYEQIYSVSTLLANQLLLSIIMIFMIFAFVQKEKNKLERKFETTNLYYESLISYNPYIVFIINIDGMITNINPKGLEILKAKKEQMIHQSIFSFLPQDDAERVKQKMNRLLEHNENEMEVSFKNSKGEWIPLLLTFVPMIVEGKNEGFFVIAKDMKELKQYQKRLRKMQKDLMNTLERQQGMTFKFVKINDQFIHTLCAGELLYKLGYSPHEIIGKDLRDFLPKEVAERQLRAYQKAWNGEIVHFEGKLNGYDYLAVLSPVIENGKVVEVIGSCVDITVRKEQEMKLNESNALRRTIIDNLPIGIVVIDHEMKIIALNKTILKIFQINEPIKQLIGKNITNYFPAVGRKVEENTGEVSKIFTPYKHFSDEVNTKNGKILKRSYFPFYMDGKLKGHLWTFEDITEQKKMENSIIQAKEEAVKANMAKSEFLSKMSHELRTPLNGILGFSHLLELDKTLTEQQQAFVEEILKGGRHLLNLINEILDLSRIETGKIKISNDEVQIDSVICECIALMKPAANKKRIKIIKSIDQCVDQMIHIDSLRLKQVILNLLDNAIKYNVEGGQIHITCKCQNGFLVIHIIDTGIGICEEELKKIYEPFYRIQHVQVEGTGLGLSLVKQLIELMNGEFGVVSKIGEGSDFWIKLPMLNRETNHAVKKDLEHRQHH